MGELAALGVARVRHGLGALIERLCRRRFHALVAKISDSQAPEVLRLCSESSLSPRARHGRVEVMARTFLQGRIRPRAMAHGELASQL
jgi:hypothetical protein